tara:strand:- start:1812 stop:2351 length:540 start_codon:yes stop_codon:yes gene_type:complete
MKIFLLNLSILSAVFSTSFDYEYKNSWKKANIDYDSLYIVSQDLLKNNEVFKSIKHLNEIVSNSNDKNLTLNCYYDLAQIYLSRSNDFEKSISYFNLILNQKFNFGNNKNNKLKKYEDLNEKSLFMIGYIYHNHTGNLSLAKKYYEKFLNYFPNSDLVSSVQYEIDVINSMINNYENSK